MDKIILHWVQIPFREPFRISNGSVAVKDSIIVEAHDGACCGFGEASPMAGSFYSVETPESTWESLVRNLVPHALAGEQRIEDGEPFARAGLDGALRDLECRRAGCRLCDLVGSDPRPIPSGVAIGIFDTVEELLDRVQRYLAHGYRRVKVKIQPGWDLEPVKAVRETFGAIDLMVDANGAYTPAQAEVFRELDRFGLMMYEQPLAREAIDDMAELQRRVRTPICADESAESLEALERIIERGSARIINIKIQRVGGLDAARKMHDRARADGLPCWVGTMPELGVASAQALHLGCLPGFTYPTDVEASARWYADDLVDPPLEIDRQGYLHIPPGPGTGFNVDREKLERYTVKRVELRA